MRLAAHVEEVERADILDVTALVLLLRIVWPLIMWAVVPVDPSPRNEANPVAEFGSFTDAFHGADLAAAIFALQCVASQTWLQSFRFGPLEWLWRRATYGTPVAMLRRPAILRA